MTKKTDRPVLVVTALPEEGYPVRDRMPDALRWSPGARRGGEVPVSERMECWRGTLRGEMVIVAVTGDGETHARRAMEVLISEVRPTLLVVLGVSGGLDPDLEPLDLIVTHVVAREDGRVFAADPEEVERLTEAVGGASGALLTADTLACTASEKRALFERVGTLGISTKGAMVDMETAVFVELSEKAGVPWWVMRVVSDGADDELPGFLRNCYDAEGGVDRKRVAREAMLNPSAVPVLLRLAHRVKRAGSALADALEAGLDGRPDGGPARAAGQAAGSSA